MILVTVGTQLPFDRLIRSVDEWASRQRGINFFAQIGPAEYKPQYMPWVEFATPDELNEQFVAATAIVGHAGMGTILTAIEHCKPVLVLPRRAALGEHRNDHQLATADRFRQLCGVHVAQYEKDLPSKLEALLSDKTVGFGDNLAESSLIDTVRSFLQRYTTNSDHPRASRISESLR